MTQASSSGISAVSGQRLGLALSGGGFRASFFHIGVLARLADLGLLRHIEIISTVSGGSIIGALYYLHLKKLLETKSDEQIGDRDYQEIVQQIERNFLKNSQHNIIMRTYINPLKNLLMSLPRYSQSVRIGRLYDQIFYQPVFKPADGGLIKMRDLIIKPKGAREDFYPLRDNQPRSAKVPVLLINATSLNTGRNWRFEASCMGEHVRDSELSIEIDKNYRLLNPSSFAGITRKHQDFELGQAISASACLPGIFNPLPIDDLYPEGICLQLIDGGVHDNQGVQGLLDKNCSHLIVSDATKQIEEQARPTTKISPMMERIRSILVDRIREEQLFRLLNREELPVVFIHTRKGLPVKVKPFIDRDGIAHTDRADLRINNQLQNGMTAEVQHLISRVRTHLDSFTEIEAYSLMMSGYQLVSAEFEHRSEWQELVSKDCQAGEWQFTGIAPWMNQPTPLYLQHLRVAGERFLKTFRLSRPLTFVTIGIFLLFFIVMIATVIKLASWSSFQISFDFNIVITLQKLIIGSGILIALVLLNLISKVISPMAMVRERFSLFWGQSLLPTMVWPIICLHLFIFDPIFIALGKLSRLGTPPSQAKV